MQEGKFNVLLDGFWGSSGKGKTATWLADHYSTVHVSSSNFPNAGHTAAFGDGTKFVAKAMPTASILRRKNGMGMRCYLSPGSGFSIKQLLKEWEECGRPETDIHSRASVVTERHAERERSGQDSTKHLASTMQGSGAALSDKIMRRPDVLLAGSKPLSEWIRFLRLTDPDVNGMPEDLEEAIEEGMRVVDGMEFRNLTWSVLERGHTWLHEGSQGYALSVDHGSHYPSCTSRNCTVQAAIDHMAIPPASVGDVYLNLRTFPIRVGNVVEDGAQVGYSGDFYPDCREITWEEVAARSGMPQEEAAALKERERTTVTKRVRRVCTFSFMGLKDAVRANGATKLVLNFVQYLNWKDAGLRGGREAFQRLSRESREFVDAVEEASGVGVVLIGTGAAHEEMICRE